MLSDHPLSVSGVGTQSRWLIEGLLKTGKYKFNVLGGAVKHESHDLNVINEDFIVKPVDGFGNRDLLRNILGVEQPDVLLLFTDPRFFIWVWEMEDEIHKICPIAYWHLWDNHPYPEFNDVLYESTDLINCINYPTYEMIKVHHPDVTNYIPHSIPKDVFHRLPEEDVMKMKVSLLGLDKINNFVGVWVSRNAKRKMPSDVIISWKMFLNELQEKYGHQDATLIMHTDPTDSQGPNLNHVIGLTETKGKVFFSNKRIGFQEMNAIYNIADFTILRSSNEGFGLSTLESLYAETPVIVHKTGGQTRQCVDWRTGEEYGFALDPEARTLAGSQIIPYIYEDHVSHQTVANSFMKMYELGKEKRREIGRKGREYALKEYSYENMIRSWDSSLTDLVEKWKNDNRTWKVETL